MIIGIAHINLLVPPGTLPHATTFYSETLGLKPRSVPAHRVHDLAWFDIGDSGQQIHIAPGENEAKSSRHPCFKLGSPEQLIELRARIWAHFERGGEAAPLEADQPGNTNSGMYRDGDVGGMFAVLC
jgi:catechol 2,3-dioxygenase-like lactoylglutathione lyase family enzyme